MCAMEGCCTRWQDSLTVFEKTQKTHACAAAELSATGAPCINVYAQKLEQLLTERERQIRADAVQAAEPG